MVGLVSGATATFAENSKSKRKKRHRFVFQIDDIKSFKNVKRPYKIVGKVSVSYKQIPGPNYHDIFSVTSGLKSKAIELDADAIVEMNYWRKPGKFFLIDLGRVGGSATAIRYL